ncbi:helix-turn-helix domain-containing protein [Halobellus ordinarius]|uniref:helix-turn-helix domain-containing protein n=1 Tax=Halobellus ordinarius TaxID=3075120 RepID=UPI002880032D|nr:helix-turn-helix domain-containing protein [Halobellus sp. ZY16]
MENGAGRRELRELLCAPRTKKILHETERKPQSVGELSTVCDASEPTLYRQVNSLLDRGLLREETEIDDNGNHYTVYRNNVKRADIQIRPQNSEVEIDLTFKDVSDQFKNLWEDLRNDS